MPDGAPSPESNHIPIGYVRRAHGIRGDVLVRGMVTDAHDRFVTGASLRTDSSESAELTVVAVSRKGDDFILRLSGVDDRNAAERLVGTRFVMPQTDRRSLGNDEWWVEDLIGCTVVDADGRELGTVIDVVQGAAQDRIVVEGTTGRPFEVPFVDELVPEVRVDARLIVVSLPAGLIDGTDGDEG